MNTKKELTQEDINELLKDEEILYLLEDLKKSKEYQDNTKMVQESQNCVENTIRVLTQ